MLTTPQIKSLKQVNISVDPEKTRERVEQIWRPASNATKNDIVALVDCNKNTVYRIFNTGSLHIKLAIAIGQVLNVNPYYLTGEANEQGEFSEAVLLQILEQHGYKELLAEIAPTPVEVKPKRKYTRRPKPDAEESTPYSEADPEFQPESEPEQEPGPEQPAAVETPINLPDFLEEDMQALIHALMILSKAGVSGAIDKLARVKEILIS